MLCETKYKGSVQAQLSEAHSTFMSFPFRKLSMEWIPFRQITSSQCKFRMRNMSIILDPSNIPSQIHPKPNQIHLHITYCVHKYHKHKLTDLIVFVLRLNIVGKSDFCLGNQNYGVNVSKISIPATSKFSEIFPSKKWL